MDLHGFFHIEKSHSRATEDQRTRTSFCVETEIAGTVQPGERKTKLSSVSDFMIYQNAKYRRVVWDSLGHTRLSPEIGLADFCISAPRL